MIESFFVELWPKTEFAQICPNFLDRIFAIYPKIFLQLKKSYVSEQILLLLTFPEKFVTGTKFAEDMNRRVLKKTRFEKIAVKVYNTYIKLIKA